MTTPIPSKAAKETIERCMACKKLGAFSIVSSLCPTYMDRKMVMRVKLMTIPKDLSSATVADAILKNFFSTLPIMIFILGEENMAKPIPINENWK